MPADKFAAIIRELGGLSDSSLETKLAEACRAFDPEAQDGVTFLRNLQDLVVRYAAGSGFVVQIISVILDSAPEETTQAAESRRAKLLEAEKAPWDPTVLNTRP